jgi:hypothetical protein
MEKIDLDVIGYSGLRQFGGIISEEFYRKLQGPQGRLIYREMADNSSVIGAIRYVIKALVRQVKWKVDPADTSDAAAVDQAEFVESCIADMSITFEDLISEVLSMLDYGWAYFELVYKLRKGDTDDPTTRSRYDDGKVGWRKIALRSQDTLLKWEFDEDDGGLRGFWQSLLAGAPVFIPIEKAILFRTETTKDNPEGRSIFRNAAIDYFFLKRISEIEAIGLERDLAGLPVMEVPQAYLESDAPQAAKDLVQTLIKMLQQLKRDERDFVLIPAKVLPDGKPSGFDLRLMSSGGTRAFNTTEIKNYYKINILQSVVAQFIQLGTQNVGSWALASSQTNLFSVALGAYLNSICAVLNQFAIPRLMTLNGVPAELWPLFSHGDIETPPLAEVGAYLTALATTGQLPNDNAIKKKLLEFAGLPIPDEDTLQGAPAGKAPPVVSL